MASIDATEQTVFPPRVLVSITDIQDAQIVDGLVLPGDTGDYASTTDKAALDITEDIDLRVEVALDDWSSGASQTLLAKWTETGNQRSYRLGVNSTGRLFLEWSPNGSAGSVVTEATTDPLDIGDGERLAVRATLDVDNEGGGYTVIFYTAESIDGAWTELETDFDTPETSIHSGSAVLEVGSIDEGTVSLATGTVFAAVVSTESGFGGTIVADPKFAEQAYQATSFADSRGNTWSVNGNAEIGSTSEVVSATILRSVAGKQEVLRGSQDIDVSGTTATTRIDGEQPFDVAITYIAELTNEAGNSVQISAAPITVNLVGADVVLSDAISGRYAIAQIYDWREKEYSREAEVFNVNGRVVAVTGPWPDGARSELVLRTDNASERDNLNSFLSQTTSGLMQIRQRGEWDDIDAHFVVLSGRASRLGKKASIPFRLFSLEIQETEPWPFIIEALGYTLQDIADNFTTLQDISDQFFNETLFDIAVFDFGS